MTPAAVLLALLLGSASQIAESRLTVADAEGYVCYRSPRAIVVDGRLDDWEGVPATDAFVDIEGDARPRPRFETRARMCWDDQYFYIAAELEEPHVWGTLVEHDAVIFRDNDFEVFLDPDGDNHQYYEFEINALNTGWDLRLVKPYRDGGPALNEWEIPGLRTAVHVRGTLNDPSDEDGGWSVEIALPWEVLREFAGVPCPPRDGDLWRVNFSRVEWRHRVVDGDYEKVPGTREDNWVWSPQGVIDMHRPERWGFVQFSTAPIGEARFRPDPDGPARDLLHRIYYAQRGHREARGADADSMEALGIATPGGMPSPTIERVEDGYVASIARPEGDGRPARVLTIREDSRVEVRSGSGRGPG